MTTPGHLDHLGIGVPDLSRAKVWYDGLVPLVGFREWFPADEDQFNYGPDGAAGTQLFFYRADTGGRVGRHDVGLQHLAFGVPSRSAVERAHAWAMAQQAEVLHAPRAFPEYGEHAYATFFRDPHGITVEVVTHTPPDGG